MSAGAIILEMSDGADAGPARRARRIRDELGLLWKQFEPSFTPEHGGDPRPVFGELKAGSIRKMLSPGGTGGVRWRSSYQRPFILWLREKHHWAAPDDLFTIPFDDRFVQYCRNGRIVRRQRRRYATSAQERVAIVVDQIEVAKGSPAFFEPASGMPRGLAGDSADTLRRLVVEEGTLLPARELSRLANAYSMCTGCGRGADTHLLFEDVIEAHCRRGAEVMAAIGDVDGLVGFAELVAKGVQGRSLAGRVDEARTAAELVEDLWLRGDLGHDRADVVKLRSRTREALLARGDPAGESRFLDSTASVFGPESEEYLSEMKCRACRAVAIGSDEAEQRVQEARTAMDRVAFRYPARRPAIDKDAKDLDFIELTRLVRRQREGGGDINEYVRRSVGERRLRALLVRTKAPIRRAVLLHWLWMATGRTDAAHLQQALALLSERPSVKHLCVLDVDEFRREINELLRPSASP